MEAVSDLKDMELSLFSFKEKNSMAQKSFLKKMLELKASYTGLFSLNLKNNKLHCTSFKVKQMIKAFNVGSTQLIRTLMVGNLFLF